MRCPAPRRYYEGGTRLHRKNADDLMLGSGRALAAEVRGCFETIKEVRCAAAGATGCDTRSCELAGDSL